MNDFFKTMWSRGWRFLAVVAVVWLIYFLINFFSPHFFDFLRTSSAVSGETLGEANTNTEIPLRLKIYNLFFKSRTTSPIITDNSSTSSNTNKNTDNLSGNNGSYVWGGGTSTVRNINKLSSVDLYIYPNSSKSLVAQNFKFNNSLIKGNNLNILSSDTLITGSISSEYMTDYYFNIDIYDSNGDYIFSIPATGSPDTKNKNMLNFYSRYTNNYNMSGYKGDGFMVIWSTNSKVESVILIKIKID